MAIFRKSYEVVGYTHDADVYCTDCIRQVVGTNEVPDEAANPVFLDDEWDYQPVCSICREPIDASIIPLQEPTEDCPDAIGVLGCRRGREALSQ